MNETERKAREVEEALVPSWGGRLRKSFTAAARSFTAAGYGLRDTAITVRKYESAMNTLSRAFAKRAMEKQAAEVEKALDFSDWEKEMLT